MIYIGETNNKTTKFLLSPLNYLQLFNKLKSILSADELLLFAKPQVFSDTTSWETSIEKQGIITSQDALDEAQKDALADYFDNYQNSILSKLKVMPDMQKVAEHLFKVPNTNNIKALISGDQVFPVLTNWACLESNVTSTADALTMFKSRPRVTSDLVILSIKYHTGAIADNKTFYISYLNKSSTEKTNNDGEYNRGRCKIGSELIVYEEVNGMPTSYHNFIIEKGADYNIVFPLLANVVVQVKDQHNKPLAQFEIITITNDVITNFTTDKDGFINLGGLRVDDNVEMKTTIENTAIRNYTVKDEDNKFLFIVEQQYFTESTIKIVNENNEIQKGYELMVEYKGNNQKYISNEEGEIFLEKLLENEVLKVINPKNIENKNVFTINEAATNNEFLFQLIDLPERMIVFKLIDKSKKSIANIPVEFTFKGGKHNAITNEEGICLLPQGSFVNKEKVRVFLDIPKKVKK
jgi:hypothetical protein